MSNKGGIGLFENSFCEQYLSRSLNSEELEAEEDQMQRNKELKQMIRKAFNDLDDEFSLSSDSDDSYLASVSNCNSEDQPRHKKQTEEIISENAANDKRGCKFTGGYTADLLPSLSDDDEFKKQKQKIKDILQRLTTVDMEKDDSALSRGEISRLLNHTHTQLSKSQLQLEEDIRKFDQSKYAQNKVKQSAKKTHPVKEVNNQVIPEKVQEAEISHVTSTLNKHQTEVSKYKEAGDALRKELNLKDIMCSEPENPGNLRHNQSAQEQNSAADKSRTNLGNSRLEKSIKWDDSVNNQSLFLNDDEGSRFIFAPCKNSSELSFGLANFADNPNLSKKDNFPMFDELPEPFGDINEKNSEIQYLQEKLELCSEHIKSLKEEESKYVACIKTLKKENTSLQKKVKEVSAERRCTEECTSKTQSYEEQLTRAEKLIKELREENETLKKSLEKSQDMMYITDPNYSTESSQELRKKLEECLNDCSSLKAMYNEICCSKEKLQIENNQFEKDLTMQKYENSLLNNLVKALVKDQEDSVRYLNSESKSLLEEEFNKNKKEYDQEYLSQAQISESDRKEIEKLANKLKTCEYELQGAREYIQKLETHKAEINEYISKTDALHQEKLALLEEEHSKKIRELNKKHEETLLKSESELKEKTLKTYTEEITRLADTYKTYYNNLTEHISSLEKQLEDKTKEEEVTRNQLDTTNEELTLLKSELTDLQVKYDDSVDAWNNKFKLMSEKQEKLLTEIDKIYNKYKSVRKTAVEMKQLLNSRSRTLKQHHEYYVKTLKEVQNCLNGTFEFNMKEKTAKNMVNGKASPGSEEDIDNVVLTIKKQLELLTNR